MHLYTCTYVCTYTNPYEKLYCLNWQCIHTLYKVLRDFGKIFLMEAIHLPFHPKTHLQIHYNL